jgi:hypothetical protein
MKIRIRGNSIRLRLLQSEVAELVEKGKVSETIRFGPKETEVLTYTLQISPAAERIDATFENNEILVSLPENAAGNWIETDQVSLEGEKDLTGDGLKILVEKDFVCLTRTKDPDNADAFPNPDADC